MKTTFELSDITIYSRRTLDDYIFINASINVDITLDSHNLHARLETGSFYINNDYNQPSNTLAVYSEYSDAILKELDNIFLDDIDNAQRDYLNELCETSFTIDELCDIKEALTEASSDAQYLVIDAERESEDEISNDTTSYVSVTEREEYDISDTETDIQVCEYPELKRFDDEKDAELFIESKRDNIDIVQMLAAREARIEFPEEF